jgi:hypothetical protein
MYTIVHTFNILGFDSDENYDYSDAVYFGTEKKAFFRNALVFML